MGLFDKLRAELIDIIEWVDDSRSTLVWRFPRYQNEIKNGAALIVRPGQVAVFVHRGELADVFEPGHYELSTDNLPILSTLQGWKHGFNSPFRSEVYFVSTRQINDLKWGTPNPIMLRDDDFGPVRLRAFGTYTMKALDPKILLKELVGTDSEVDADEIGELMRSIIVSAFADLLGTQKVAALDLAANYREMGDELAKLVNERIDDEYGLEVPALFILNVSLPEAVEEALDKRSSMGIIGDMGRYQAYQFGTAMGDMANNPGGGGAMGEGLGMGMGFAMANKFAGMGGAPQAEGMPSAPPPPPQASWHIAANGQTQGPFPQQSFQQGILSGQVTPDTLVWTAGMDGWKPAGQVPQLVSLFSSNPAPPPPPAPAT
ncbi:SPFH domain-containing protein [Stratiformator vulcanicus]|uniref:SPFH domain / Band 7 family protein n=1 Tax=Stratiformator vulcanicus TaxID=2527980 RepID=A0A517R775_9PLAN|nr:SPFH domain-containing protein [Stratiformator vulcanicus]QDT39702.1 SPFH domain / Band 7 family protein [Stratiformator vulcanicus]